MAWNLSGKGDIVSADIAEGRYLVTLDNSGEVRGADLSNGEVRFTFLASRGEVATLPGKLFLLDTRGRVSCRSYSGGMLWQFSTGETEGCGFTLCGDQLYVFTENAGLFALNTLYGKAEDARVTDGSSKIAALTANGMFKMALGQARYLLSEVEPGNSSLNRQYALLLQKSGETDRAFQAWEKYISVSGAEEVNRTGAKEELRAVSSAKWVTALAASGKFSPFYKVQDKIVALCEGEISVLESSGGAESWKYRFGSPRSIPQTAVPNAREVFVFGDNEVLALSLEAQKELWRTPLKVGATALCTDGKRLYAGTWNNGVYILDPRTGKVLRRLLQEVKAVFPVQWGGVFYCVGLEGVIAAFRDDRELFRVALEDRFLALPLAVRGMLVVPTAQGYINAYSMKDGSLLWSQRLGVQAASLAADEEHIYAVFTNQVVAAFRLQDGGRVWAVKATGESPEMISCGEGMLAVSGDNKIVLYRSGTGEAGRTFRTAGRISSIVLEGNDLFARLEDGLIYRFEGH
jgi:outer membrane protein assembly factor BamB